MYQRLTPGALGSCHTAAMPALARESEQTTHIAVYYSSPFNPVTTAFLPLWLGFAANTVLLALVLWSPFVPWVLRQYLRCKRGLCVKCAYDLRGADHEACPECGHTC